MTTEFSRVVSDMAISPGEVLQEEIEARGMSHKELAARLGRPPQAVNEIIRWKKAITPDGDRSWQGARHRSAILDQPGE